MAEVGPSLFERKSDGVYYVSFLGSSIDTNVVVCDIPVGGGPTIVDWWVQGYLTASGADAQLQLAARAYSGNGYLPTVAADQDLMVYQTHDDSAGANNPTIATSGGVGPVNLYAHGHIGEYKTLLVLSTKIKISFTRAGVHTWTAGTFNCLFRARPVNNVVGMF